MSKKILVAITVGFSMGLSGCSNLLYQQTAAPVYTMSSSQQTAKPSKKTATVTSIEQPNSSVIVNDSQDNPYSQPVAAAAPTVARPNMGPTSGSVMTDTAQTAINNDPRVKEGSEVLAEGQQTVDKTSSAVQNAAQNANQKVSQATRPAAVTTVKNTAATASQNADNAVKKATQSANDTAVAAVSSTVSATRPKPATAQSATKSLIQEARVSVAAGNYEKAASALERAHRIEPSNAKILYDISQIRYAQGKYRQAESFASKAANYTKSPGLSKKIWTILSNSRKALGNSSGAAAAAQKAANF